MSFEFATPDLRALDRAPADVLIAGIFEDVRPMNGVAGVVDFRLAGMVSEKLREAFVTGALGDALLVPTRPRLACDRLVLIGLGPRAAFDEEVFRKALLHMVRVARGLAPKRCVVELPGRGASAIGAARAAEITFEIARDFPPLESYCLVEPEAERPPFTVSTRPAFR